jgi:hypothetical protein
MKPNSKEFCFRVFSLIVALFVILAFSLCQERKIAPVTRNTPALVPLRTIDAEVQAAQIDVFWLRAVDRNEKSLGLSPRVSVLIQNKGTLAIHGLRVALELLDESGSVIAKSLREYTEDIEPGKYKIIGAVTFWRSSEAVCFEPLRCVVVRVMVDPANVLAEIDETNNVALKLSTAEIN